MEDTLDLAGLKAFNKPVVCSVSVKHGRVPFSDLLDKVGCALDSHLEEYSVKELNKYRAIEEQYNSLPTFKDDRKAAWQVMHVFTAPIPVEQMRFEKTPVLIHDDKYLLVSKQDLYDALESGLAFRLAVNHELSHWIYWSATWGRAAGEALLLAAGFHYTASSDDMLPSAAVLQLGQEVARVMWNMGLEDAAILMALLANYCGKTARDHGLDTDRFEAYMYDGVIQEQDLKAVMDLPVLEWDRVFAVMLNPDSRYSKTYFRRSHYTYCPNRLNTASDTGEMGQMLAHRIPDAVAKCDDVEWQAWMSTCDLPSYPALNKLNNNVWHYLLDTYGRGQLMDGLMHEQYYAYMRWVLGSKELCIVPVAGPTRMLLTKGMWEADIAWQAHRNIEYMRRVLQLWADGQAIDAEQNNMGNRIRDWKQVPRWDTLRTHAHDMRLLSWEWPCLP